MFTNIGKKIKVLAQVFCWLGIIGSVISGGGFLISGIKELSSRYYSSSAAYTSISIGISIIILGALFAWIGSFVLYGFGELVDKTSDIERYTRFGGSQKYVTPMNPQQNGYAAVQQPIGQPYTPAAQYTTPMPTQPTNPQGGNHQ